MFVCLFDCFFDCLFVYLSWVSTTKLCGGLWFMGLTEDCRTPLLEVESIPKGQKLQRWISVLLGLLQDNWDFQANILKYSSIRFAIQWLIWLLRSYFFTGLKVCTNTKDRLIVIHDTINRVWSSFFRLEHAVLFMLPLIKTKQNTNNYNYFCHWNSETLTVRFTYRNFLTTS